MVGRTTGRPPVPAIGITEPFTFPPDQATSDQIATTPDDDGTQGQQQIGFPTSPAAAGAGGGRSTREEERGQDTPSPGTEKLLQVPIPSAGSNHPGSRSRPRTHRRGSPTRHPVAKGKTSQSNKRSDPLPTAYVEVLYKNRLSKSEMTISIDGQVVWRRNLTVSNLVKKVMGKQVRTEISVPQGVHSVRVRISSPEAGINATDTLRTLFHGGEARVLGVSLDTEDKKLSLYWKG